MNRSFLFPKLRFGNQYQFRARGVDLAGNSVPVTSTDASTATPPFTHYRYEPVLPPVPAGDGTLHPGRGDALPGAAGRPGRHAGDQRPLAVPARVSRS